MVDVLCSIAGRLAIHRGTYTAVKNLNTKIRAFVGAWNERAHPFTWTAGDAGRYVRMITVP